MKHDICSNRVLVLSAVDHLGVDWAVVAKGISERRWCGNGDRVGKISVDHKASRISIALVVGRISTTVERSWPNRRNHHEAGRISTTLIFEAGRISTTLGTPSVTSGSHAYIRSATN